MLLTGGALDKKTKSSKIHTWAQTNKSACSSPHVYPVAFSFSD